MQLNRCSNPNGIGNRLVDKAAAIAAALGMICCLNACSALYEERADIRGGQLIDKALKGDKEALEIVKAMGAKEYKGTITFIKGANVRTTPAVIEDAASGDSNKANVDSSGLVMKNPISIPDLNNPANEVFFGAYHEGTLVWINAINIDGDISPSKFVKFDGITDASLTNIG